LIAKNEELTGQLEELNGMIKQLTTKTTQLEQQTVIQDFEFKKAKEIDDIRNQKYVMKHVAKTNYNTMIKDIKRQLEAKLNEVEMLKQALIKEGEKDNDNEEKINIALSDLINNVE
jgi:hypothetical protein